MKSVKNCVTYIILTPRPTLGFRVSWVYQFHCTTIPEPKDIFADHANICSGAGIKLSPLSRHATKVIIVCTHIRTSIYVLTHTNWGSPLHEKEARRGSTPLYLRDDYGKLKKLSLLYYN